MYIYIYTVYTAPGLLYAHNKYVVVVVVVVVYTTKRNRIPKSVTIIYFYATTIYIYIKYMLRTYATCMYACVCVYVG